MHLCVYLGEVKMGVDYRDYEELEEKARREVIKVKKKPKKPKKTWKELKSKNENVRRDKKNSRFNKSDRN